VLWTIQVTENRDHCPVPAEKERRLLFIGTCQYDSVLNVCTTASYCAVTVHQNAISQPVSFYYCISSAGFRLVLSSVTDFHENVAIK
jgi:hypothetical protein